MDLKIFSIYDKATESFNTPFFMLTTSEAIRAFVELATDENTNICKHPHDFELYELGNYNNQTSEFMTKKSYIVLTAVAAKQYSKEHKQIETSFTEDDSIDLVEVN